LKSGNGFLRYYTLPCHECGARQRERNSWTLTRNMVGLVTHSG
jgi:hypothetical protein